MLPPSGVGILIVDDEPSIRDALRIVCEDEGYAVAEVANGRDALAYLRTHPQPLVVLLDWWMPYLDGLEILERVAADASFATCHVYLLHTAVNPEKARLRARIPTTLHVRTMPKPFDLDTLLATVADLAATALALRDAPRASPDDET